MIFENIFSLTKGIDNTYLFPWIGIILSTYITKKHGKGSNEENSFHGGSYLRFGFYKKYIWLLYAEKDLL